MPSILTGEEIRRIFRDDGIEVSEDQVQPAGLDLSIDNILQYPKDPFKMKNIGIDSFVAVESSVLESDQVCYSLDLGAYLVEFCEVVSIPEDCIGIILPRSTLLRNGLDLRTALFDPGYRGRPKAMLVCYRPAEIVKGSRIGQLIIFRSEKRLGHYRGRYQNEGLIEERLSK